MMLHRWHVLLQPRTTPLLVEPDYQSLHMLSLDVLSSVITLALVGCILFGVLIFIGIEGNHEIVRHYELLAEQDKFNNATQIPQFDELYRNATQIANLTCLIAKLDMISWNNKTAVDAAWFSFSIVSTVGWGIFYPKSDVCKVICLVYSAFGVILFASLIGAVVRSFKDEEPFCITRYCISKCCIIYHM